MTDEQPLGVYLYRWDSIFREWREEAAFRLFHRAEAAAKALSKTERFGVYKVVDCRDAAGRAFFYVHGTDVAHNPVLDDERAQPET